MYIHLGQLFDFIFRTFLEAIAVLIEGLFDFTFERIANAIYGNRNGGPQTVARWGLYVTIIASAAITLSYMIYGEPLSLGWTSLVAIAGIFSLIIVVIGERRYP